MNGPVNLIALDQERGGIVAVINGVAHWDPDTTEISVDDLSLPHLFDPVRHLNQLPVGGGIVVADGNTWSVRNELSVSQYCWADEVSRADFIEALAERGYRAINVANKLTESLYRRNGLPQALAVVALYRYAHAQVSSSRGRPSAGQAASPSALPCGCEEHWSFDSGYPVRPSHGDISFGMRRDVTQSFLRLQNNDGYQSAFAADVVDIAWTALDREGRQCFNLKLTKPTCDSRNRLMAVAACTHDPDTGQMRTYQGKPWGVGFITRHIIGLNGTMRGTGLRSPGNPMRAVLRVLGRRHGAKVNRDERAALDRATRTLIRALQQHPMIPRPNAGGEAG